MKLGLIKDDKLLEKIPLVDVRFTHSLCVGQTGSGKTTSFVYPNILERMKLNHGILFFDIKGSEHIALKSLADESKRLDDIIEIGKPWGRNINILDEMNESSFMRLLKVLIGMGKDGGGSNAYFYNAAQSLGLTLYSVFRTCKILIQEFNELDIDIDFINKKIFTLEDIYQVIVDIDSLYSFLIKLDDFIDLVKSNIEKNSFLYFGDKKTIYKNVILNLVVLEKYFKKLAPYYISSEDRSDTSKFDKTLLSVLNTLVEAFGFMVSSSSKYISTDIDALNIVDALQDKKIVVVNVRVIPDAILEILLEKIFEQLIDLNIKNEDEREPISIFIDEAQRLINKNIPLDVLRSSKVDVILTVQNEQQLVSKFNSREDWQQISMNIAQKIAFRSSLFDNSFLVDTGDFKTFEYTKEYENKMYKAIPKFINQNEALKIEYKYQHEILQLPNLNENEYLIYDVSHFEKEREVVVANLKTNKKYYKKLFNDIEEDIVEKYIESNLIRIYESYIKTLINDNFDLKDWINLINDFGVINKDIYENSIAKIFKTKKSAIKYIENNYGKNIYKYVKNNSTEEYIVFAKLSDDKLKEFGYTENHRELLGIKNIQNKDLEFMDEENIFNW